MKGTFLPDSFVNNMRKLLGDELDSFLKCFDEPHNAGLRTNRLKLEPEEFAGIAPVPVEPVRWIPNGFYYDEKEQPAKHPFYYAGLYYIQEPSAMTPASLLPMKDGARVLDLCAAPGGKTTELGARLGGRGVLVTNDISNSRAKALLKNVELFGIRNAIVVSEAPNKLAERFEGYFDSILVDAPCSGEGMFRKSHAIIKNWEQYGTGYYADLQRQILPSAVKMLAPGGYMLYSTCTFSPEEDEASIAFILDNYPDMEIVPAVKDGDERFEGFARGIPEYCGGRDEIKNALRIYPHRVRGEGHFIALLRKKSDEEGEKESCSRTLPATAEEDKHPNTYSEQVRKKGRLPDECWDFLERIGFKIDAERLELRENRLYLMPEGIPELKGLRILRSGLLLGEVKTSATGRKGDRFEPSQALACALKSSEYDNIMELAPDGAEVIKYLKCESAQIPDGVKDGYVLVCTGGFPLGWGKVKDGRMKNKYLPGWRMQ